MRYLVIGGGGFIGSHLCESLLAGGHKVRVFDRPNARYLDILAQKGAEIIPGDFMDVDVAERALSNCDMGFHLVSATVPQTSNENPIYDIETNVLGTLRFLDVARRSSVKRIIFASSGGTVYGIPQEIPIKESHPTAPINSYGITKLMVEKYLHLYWKLYGLDYSILRISNAYGERQPITQTQGVISSFLGRAIQQEEITVWGDGSVIRDYIYVGDISNAFMKAASYKGNLKVFNVGSGQGHSITDIICTIENIMQKPLKIKYAPGRSFDVPINILDITQAKTQLKWQPEVGILDGISRAYEWFLIEQKSNFTNMK